MYQALKWTLESIILFVLDRQTDDTQTDRCLYLCLGIYSCFLQNAKEDFSDGVSPVLVWKEGRLRLCSLLFIQPCHGILNFTLVFSYTS